MDWSSRHTHLGTRLHVSLGISLQSNGSSLYPALVSNWATAPTGHRAGFCSLKVM